MSRRALVRFACIRVPALKETFTAGMAAGARSGGT